MAFAPQPIVFRYGDDGVLGQAAAAAGANAGYQQQRASDMAFINSEMNRRQQADLLEQQNVMDSMKLQMAHQLELQRANQTPTSLGSLSGKSPFTQAIAAANQQAKTAAITAAVSRGDVSADDPIIQLAQNAPDVGAAQTAKLIEDQRNAKQKTAKAAAAKQEKEAFLNSLPDDVKQEVASLADSDGVTLSQLRIAADRVHSRVHSDQQTQTRYQVSDLASQMRDRQRELRDLQHRMMAGEESDGGKPIDPEQSPDTLNPQFADPNSWHGPHPFNDNYLVSGGDKKAMAAMLRYYGIKRQYDELAAQRNSLIGRGQPQQAAAPAAPAAAQQPAAGGQQFSVGQTINVGGKSFKVVGFDHDGMPLVDPA